MKQLKEHDLRVVALIKADPAHVALTPIQFNGQERMGLVIVRQEEGSGQLFMQLLAILPEEADVIQDGAGREPSCTMTPTDQLN